MSMATSGFRTAEEWACPHQALIASLLAIACGAADALSAPNFNLPMDHPYTLRNPEASMLEKEYHRLAAGDAPLSYIFPRPCRTDLDSTRACPEARGWSHADTSRDRYLSLSPIAGMEHRYGNDDAGAASFGVWTEGASQPVSFRLDARLYTELHEDALHASYDREFVERQDEEASGSVAYSSFSRFRSNLSYDWSWGRLTAARDAAHWGPGLLSNLVFHQDAIPFNQLTFTTHLGPLKVQSLYGQLATDTNWAFDTSTSSRSVYAHRYELRAGRNLLIGVSEQMILHRHEAPFAFVPLVPLYIAKAAEKERLNNGNLAADLSWRLPGIGTAYTEFLIDDMQSPTSLFSQDWGNKWAWMAGILLARDLHGAPAGVVAEYSRIEPWVYTHYLPGTAQTAHFGHPLGNQLGPNSQAFKAKAYLQGARAYFSLSLEAVWKGEDPGSSIHDIHSKEFDRKQHLRGIGSPSLAATPFLNYVVGGWSAYASVRLADRVDGFTGIQYRY